MNSLPTKRAQMFAKNTITNVIIIVLKNEEFNVVELAFQRVS